MADLDLLGKVVDTYKKLLSDRKERKTSEMLPQKSGSLELTPENAAEYNEITGEQDRADDFEMSLKEALLKRKARMNQEKD